MFCWSFPISLYEAIQGTKIPVPTLDGPVTLTIPPGTSSHAKLRIKGRGIFRGHGKGRSICRIVRIVLPKDLDGGRSENLFEKLTLEEHPIHAREDLRW